MQPGDIESLRQEIIKLSKEIEDTKELLRTQIHRIWKMEQEIKTIQYQKSIPALSKPTFEKPEEKVVHAKPAIPTVSELDKPIVQQEVLKEMSSLPSVKETKNALPPIVTSPAKSQTYSMDLEAKIGGNWLSKIGILTLFLGLAFLFQYAYQHSWISETTRVVIGILTGLVLLSLGEYFHNKNKYIPYARVMTGGGIAVLYLSFYAAYGFYHLIAIYPALGLMLLTTLTALFFSIRYNTEINAVIGVLGAYLTPVLLKAGMNDVYLYLSYSFILTFGILLLCYWKKWKYTLVLGIFGGYLLPIYLLSDSAQYLIPILAYYLVVSAGVFWVTASCEWEEISCLGVLGGYLVPPILLTNTTHPHPPVFILSFYLIITAGVSLFTQIRKWQIFSWIGIFLAYLVPAYLLREQTQDSQIILLYYFLTTAGIQGMAYFRKWQDLSVMATLGGFLVPAFLFFDVPLDNVHILIYFGLLTLISYLVSAQKDWFGIAVLGVIGGYLGPLFLTPHYNYHSENFPYFLILTLLSIGLGVYRGWQPMIYLAYVFTSISVFAWGQQHYLKSLLGITETWLVIFFLIQHIGTSLNSLIQKMKLTEWGIFIQLLIAASYFSPTYWMLKPDYPYWPGYIAIILIGFYLLNALIAQKRNQGDILLLWNQIGLASVFAALAIPILLDQQWITLGWAMEAVILTWIGLKGKNVYLRTGGLVLLAGVVVRLFFYDRIDIYYPHKDFVLIFNRRFLAFLSGILSSYGILYLIQKNKTIVEKSEKVGISLGLAILANILTLWVFSVEILDFIDAKYGFWLLNPEKVNDLWMMKQMALSCLWAVYSILLVTLGMWKRQTFPRIFAIALFGITILKVFLMDLSSLTGFPRILSFIVLGLILLLVSYMYQRFQEKLKVFLTRENNI